MVQTPNRQTTASPEQRYQEMRQQVAGFTDRLGSSVDEGIFETVVMLNLLGITTFQSCEGHLDHGCFYPWVTVIDEEQDRLYNHRWLAVCELEAQAKEAGTQEACDRWLAADVQLRLMIARCEQESAFYRRLTSLLDTYYEHSVVPGPARLLVMRFRSESRYRIEPGFTHAEKSIPDDRKPVYLARGQEEMRRFTDYLKRLYFEAR